MKNYLSNRITLLSLMVVSIGTYFFWKLLEELHDRGVYTIGRYRENGQYSDTSLWVVYSLAIFFGLLIIVVSLRMSKKR